MVLAAGGDRELFGRPFRRRTRRCDVARHALRNGHGGGVVNHLGRAGRADAVGRRQADRRRRQGAGECLPALRRRSHLVGRSGEGAACAKEAAILTSAPSSGTAIARVAFGSGSPRFVASSPCWTAVTAL